MNICKYCNQEAFFPPKTKWGGWCCKKTFYLCDGYRKKLSENSNSWNKGLTKDNNEIIKKCSLLLSKRTGTFKGRKHTQITKSKISSKMAGNKNAHHRGDRQSYYNQIRMDSKWEVGVAKYLDSNNIIWKYNERGYILSTGQYYYPDFFIYDSEILQKLIEVKGFFRENNRKKFDLFLKEYPNIKIDLWQKKDLVDFGIINKQGYIINV